MKMHSINEPWISGRLKSFSFALEGLRSLWCTEWNIRIHFLATLLVVTAGIYHSCSRMEWVALILSVAIVWIAEAVNTALEYLSDFAAENQFYPQIKKVKDIAAAAVLIASLASAATGIIIFLF